MAFNIHLLLILFIILTTVSAVAPRSSQHCKPQLSDISWPSKASWQSLNESVSGRLTTPVPPGAACHAEWPTFDNATCQSLTSEWLLTNFHYQDLVSVDYNDETCLPDPGAPCSDKGYPSYVINAATAKDVQKGISFARNTGVRLVVKATGHDFPGRSSGSASLSIDTHNLRNIEIVKAIKSNSPTTPSALVKISAGERFHDVYQFAIDNKLTIIGGGDPHVGITGWTLGGGHGPVTAMFGMGADQVVEMVVVTADGKLRTINGDCEPELFWALRGSGGSTYAVVLSMTVKAYPSLPTAEYLYSYNTTSDTDTFWSMAATFHSQLPRLSKAGLMGYYFIYPSGIMNQSIKGTLTGQFFGPGLSAQEIEDIVKPMEDEMTNANWSDPVHVGGVSDHHEDFTTNYFKNSEAQTAGISGRLGSHLLDERALTGDRDVLKAALRKSTPAPWLMLGHFVAGPGTHNPPDGIPGGSNAVGPGWRKSLTHIVLPRAWTALDKAMKKAVTEDLRDVRVPALAELAPDAGAYVNEVDPTVPNWQTTLYGDNYQRLLAAKKEWDPQGVFWCKHCVGSELWDAVGAEGVENGVGQSLIKLCRKV